MSGLNSLVPNNSTVNGSINLLTDSVIAQTGNSATAINIFNGQITGSANLGFIAGSTVLTNPNNNFTGNLTVDGSYTAIALQTGSTSGALAGNHSIVLPGANNVLPNGASFGNVILYGTGGQTTKFNGLDLGGFNATVNGISSAGAPTYRRWAVRRPKSSIRVPRRRR